MIQKSSIVLASQIQVFAGDAEPDAVATSEASRAALDKALKDAK